MPSSQPHPHNGSCVMTHAIFSPPPPQQTLCYCSCHLPTPTPTTDPVLLLMPSSHHHPHNGPCATAHAIFSPPPPQRTLCDYSCHLLTFLQQQIHNVSVTLGRSDVQCRSTVGGAGVHVCTCHRRWGVENCTVETENWADFLSHCL